MGYLTTWYVTCDWFLIPMMEKHADFSISLGLFVVFNVIVGSGFNSYMRAAFLHPGVMPNTKVDGFQPASC